MTTTHQNKQLQFMMNLSLLSSLNHKPLSNVQQFQSLPQSQTQPVYQIIPQPLTQMSYHSMYSPHTTLLSYDFNQVPTRENSFNNNFINPLYYPSSDQKANTVMSYHYIHHHHQPQQIWFNQLALNNNSFIGKKTERQNDDTTTNNNKVETTLPSKNTFHNVFQEFKMQTQLIEEEENELNKINGRTNKHHSAPIKMLSYYNLNRNKLSENKEKNKEHIFETHLLKKLIQDENDKVHKCNHPTCDLAYRTKKQKISHHSKMDPECQKDSILFLELLSKERDIINKMNKEFKIQNKDKINKINRKMMFIKKNFSFCDYAQMICKGSIMLEEDENNIIN
jgi:hypothetical protein